MIFRLFEMRLNEDIESMKKYYPNIKEEEFQELIELDPTYEKGSKNAGTYGKWILNLANKGNLDNKGHVYDLLARFEAVKNQLINKDIMKYKSIEDVDAMLNDSASYKEQSHAQQVRQRQKDRKNVDLDKDATLVYQDSDWEVWVPHTYAASCKLGQGSKWCTATTESDYYYNFYKTNYGGDYYINISKSNPDEKYQFHIESGQYMDADDDAIDVGTFLDQNPGLKDFYTSKIMDEIAEAYTVENGMVELEFTSQQLQDMIKKCEGNYRGNIVGGDWALKLLDGEAYDDFFSNTNTDWDYVTYYQAPLDAYIRDELHSLGVEGQTDEEIYVSLNDYDDIPYGEEIVDAFLIAFDYGRAIGSENEAYQDLVEYIRKYFPNFNDIYEGTSIQMSIEEAVEQYMSGDLSDYSNPLEQAMMEKFIDEWNFGEPRYGWDDFDEEAFQEHLLENLQEIER